VSAVGRSTRWPRTALRAGRDGAPATETTTTEPGQGVSDRACVEGEIEIPDTAYDSIELTQRDSPQHELLLAFVPHAYRIGQGPMSVA
jgi:hypothetical protein